MKATKAMPATKKRNKGAWTAEEDRKLAEVIAVHGAKRWKTVAAKADFNICGKSCRLRWLNYLRPNIKRGNISDQEEDLILRLLKLLGNRLPGRTDNEIKNYWNSHLSKKINQTNEQSGVLTRQDSKADKTTVEQVRVENREDSVNNLSTNESEDVNIAFNIDDFFDFSNEDTLNLQWMSESFLKWVMA